MKTHQKTIGTSDEWLTPRYILDSLGSFDLDPCAAVNMPWETADRYFDIEDDGLSMEWFGRVWLNPPFNRKEKHKWMSKMAEHNNGIMLVPASCETEAFKKYVWGKCSGILMLDHRPYFYYPDGTRSKANCGCTICLISYGEDNLESLEESGLGIVLNQSRPKKRNLIMKTKKYY